MFSNNLPDAFVCHIIDDIFGGVFSTVILLYAIEELLSMAPNLSTCARPNEVLHLFPVIYHKS